MLLPSRLVKKACLKAAEIQPLVITLDLMLPGISGLEVCEQLRSNPETEDLYVIMVTALGDDDNKLTGFTVGADDYMVKPFQSEELVLRIKAAAKRMKRILKPKDSQEIFDFEGLRLDATQHRVWIDDEEIKMTITEYKLLTHLLRKQDQLCSRGELLQEVWELPPNLNTSDGGHPHQTPPPKDESSSSFYSNRSRCRVSILAKSGQLTVLNIYRFLPRLYI